jgi:hypothetical protein
MPRTSHPLDLIIDHPNNMWQSSSLCSFPHLLPNFSSNGFFIILCCVVSFRCQHSVIVTVGGGGAQPQWSCYATEGLTDQAICYVIQPLKALSSCKYIQFWFVPHRKHSVSITATKRLMLLMEIIAVYCENHAKHINTKRGQNTYFLDVTTVL